MPDVFIGTEVERNIEEGGVISGIHAELHTTYVELSATQIKALHNTPVEVIADPGAGKAILIDEVIAELQFDSAAYAGIAAGDDIEFRYTNAAGTQIFELETTGLLDATDYEKHYKHRGNAQVHVTADAPVVAVLGGAVTTGDSPLTLTIKYQVVIVEP